MNESVFTQAQNENTDKGTQLDRANLISLDREYFDYVKSGSFGHNPDVDFAWLDDWTERRFGVNGGGKGRMWNRSPNKQPFASPWEYSGKIEEMLNKGYEAITTPEEKAWFAAEKSGNREEMIKLANISLTKRGANIADTISPIESQSVSVGDIPKTDEEIDTELEEYGRKIKTQNFSAHFLTFADDFTPDEKEIVYASLRHGDGLPAEKEADYLAVWRDNPEKAARLHYLVELSRKNEWAWMKDNLVHPFVTGIENIRYGIGDELGDFAEFQGAISAMKEIVSRDGERRMWNDAERETYRKLVETESKNPLAGRIERMGLGPREIVDGMCARRMAREALPREEQLKRRKEELMLRLATSHKPYDDYNPISNAISGAIGTIPYMAVAAVPYAGIAINTLAQFGNVRNDIIMNGGNPDEGIGTQFLLAAGWSAIEKQQFLTLTNPLTGLQKKAILDRIAQTAWKNGKLGALGSAIRQGAPEFVAKTFAECVEEGLQGAVEGGTKQWWMPEEKGGGDWRKTISAALTQGGKDFVESIGTMGLLSLVGGGINQTQARRNALSVESIVDYGGKKLQVMNILSGRVKEMVDVKNIPANAQKMHNEVVQMWEAHKGNAVAALDEMREKYGLTDDQARTIGDYLDLRSTLLNIARTSNTDEEANAIAAFAGGAYRVGQTTGMGDTAYDVTDLFRMISPNITVEDIEVDDMTKAPVASPAVENLRQERDAAVKRVDEAKVGSQRKAAERELRRINQRLKAAEAKENAVSYPKMTMRRVTIPVGKNGETRSFVIREDNEAPDIHSAGYAISVSDAVKGAKDTKDGKKISIEEFKALPLEQKLGIAVTQDQYMAMSEADRAAYVSRFNLGGSGSFSLLDENNREIFNSDAIVKLFRGKVGTPGARIGGNWSLAHEYTHGVVRFLRDLGAIDEGTVALMQKLFGPPVAKDELWNEEAMANGFAEFLRGEFDFRRLTPEERREAMGFFERVWDIIKDFFRRIFGKEIDEPPVVTNTRKEAERAVFNALRNGDLSGLDQYAGIEFEEEKGEEEKGKREEVSQGAQEAASKPSVAKTANEPPKGEERAPAASTPSNAAKDALKEPAKAKTTPTATPTAATDIAAVVEQIENPIATAANLPARTNTKMTIFTPGYEMEIECEMMWVPLNELAESTDDREVQMRDRTRRATDEQVRSKTRKGVFRPLALYPGKKSDDGAPIVGGGMKIISGHGRKRMLEQLASEGRFNEYLSAINAEAQRQGVPTAPEGMKNPVLVLRVTGGLDKKSDLNRFAELSNRWGGLERSGAELAESDARKITDALLRLYNPDASGNLLAASNRDFMAAFLKEVGATGLTNADGTPTPEAALRVQRALMTAIFGNDEKIRAIIQNLLEKSGELSLGNLTNALMRSAGKLLAMKRAKGSFDIVNDVREAAYHYIAWRSAQQKQKSLSFADYLREQDMFADIATPMQAALAKLLEVGRFGTVLDEYSKLVAQEAVDAQGSFDFAENRTPLQLLGYAERNTLAAEETPVTPDPTSQQSAQPTQTPPAIEKAPEEPSATPVEAAQEVLTPPAPETFAPTAHVPGTATLPGPGAEGIKAHQVSADGKPSTTVKTLPAGAWNLLRAPFDVSRPPAPSAQDKAGRGLGISNPPPVKWGKIFPHFQGNKTEMAERTTQAIRAKMSKAEREYYTTIVDYFGGGGCWGLFHALESFPNVKHLVVNEFDSDRLGKIRLLHEIDGEVATEAEKILFNDALYPRIKEACAGSSAPVTAANKVEQLFKREITDPRERAVIQAWIDCAHTMLGSQAEATSVDPTRVGIEASLAKLREDGRKAKEAADAFKSRQGARIDYVAGDAVANSLKMPHGSNVMAIADPPYYLTADYQQKTILGLEKVPDNWSYRATQDFLHSLVDKGDGIVYTDEAWWFKESYKPDMQADFFSGGKSTFGKEQEILLDLINTLDHFDVAGRVVGRQEVLGVHHGHETNTETESSQNGNDVLADTTADQRGDASNRSSVRRMARELEGQGRSAWQNGRSGRPRSGEVALAREVIIQDIAASLEKAATEITTGATVDTDAISRLARYSVRQVRKERMAEYAQFVSKNAEQLLKTMDADGLPIPFEMRVDQSMSDIRFSVQMGKRAREEAAAMIRKYRPDLAEDDAEALTAARDRHPDTPVLTEDEGVLEEIWNDILPKITNLIAAFETPKERKAALLWFCKKTIRLPEDAPKVTEAIKTAERAKVDPMQYERPGDILEKFSEFRPKEPPINPDTVPELSDKRDMGNGVTTYLVQDDKAGQLAMRRIINTHWGKDANPWCLLQGDGYGNLSDGSNGGYDAWHYWQHYNALPKRVAFQNGKLLAFMATDKDVKEQWWDRADEAHDGIPIKHETKSETEYGASTTTETIELMQDGTEISTGKKRESIAPDGTRTIEEWDVNGESDRYDRRTRWPSGMMENTCTTKKYDYTYFSTVTNNILEIHTLRLSDSTTKEITWEVDSRTTMRLLSGHDGYTLYRYERHGFRETDLKYIPDTVETWLASAEAALRRGEAVPPLPGTESASTTPRFSVKLSALPLDEAKERISAQKNIPFRNFFTDLEVTLSSSAEGKLVSKKAAMKSVENGFTFEQHNAMAASVGELFERGFEAVRRGDRKGDANIKTIRRYVCPVAFDEKKAFAWITVKESKQHGAKIYSVESIELEAFSRKVEEELLLTPHALNAPTPQIVPYSLPENNGRGRSPEERHHVRRGRTLRNIDDTLTSYVAAQIMGGTDVTIEDMRKIVSSASSGTRAADILERAKSLANDNRAKAVAKAASSVAETSARLGDMLESDRLGKALSDAVTMGAKAANPETGRKLQQAIERRRIRDLQSAEGFTAAEIMAELPISLADGVLATAELERTPEELAKLEAAKKNREEERAKALETEEGAEELADPETPMRDPTEAERKAVDDLLDRARMRNDLAKQEEERRRAEKAKRDAEEADGGESDAGGDAADDIPLLPEEAVRRIAPVFESADVFSWFIIELTGDKTLEKHSELPSTGEMWKSPVAVRELKKTAADILRRLAKDTLGSPSINYARNLVDRAINELESDLETKTFNAVRHKIAHIYEMIWDNAHRITKNELMEDLEKTVSKLTQKGRFSYTQEELDRKIPAKIERWAKWVLKYARMGEAKLQDEIANLEKRTSENPAREDGKMPTPVELAEAADKLAVAKVYGHLKGKTIGEMRDLIDQIAAKLDGERQAFELRRAKIEEANKTIVDALVNALTQGKVNRRKRAKAQSKIDRAMAAMISSIDQQMVDLIRFCTDPELRKKALEAIDELTILINEGGNRYRNTLATAQEEIHDGLKTCYGSAEKGIRHLHEELPPEIVEQFFRQSSDQKRTYGHLLQLYASCLQRDYAENIHIHGRDEQIAAMEAALSAQDKMFHTWAVNWYKHNREALSDAVEEVTGLPVIAPDELYVPVRVETEPSGIPAEVVAWSPVPRALSRRVRHGLDFDENAHFLTMVNEQAEIRAQTIGYSMAGIILRDTIASRDVQTAARRNASPSDMNAVILHLRDILAQDVGKERSDGEICLKFLRKWAARFNIAWNPSSALAQPASIPVWANVLLDGEAWGAMSVLKAMSTAATEEGRAAIAELRASDGYRARYKLGWSEEVANVYANPNEPKLLSKLGAAYDKGMILSQFTDAACSLWIAQGFYRHATDVFVRRGETIEEAKRKALALTWAAVEQTQQSGRTENLSAIQRGRGKNWVNAALQFKTAQILQNSYIIRAYRDVRAGVPGAKGRLLRAIFISTVWVPSYLSLKGALWALIMGAKPEPDDEEEMPLWFREMLYSAADGMTAPLFVTSLFVEKPLREMFGLKSYPHRTGFASIDTIKRLAYDTYDLITDPIMLEEELTSEKIIDDIWKVVGDTFAPARHMRKAINNRRED